MEQDDRYGHAIPFVPHHGHWPEIPGYHPHHHSSLPDYGVMYGYADGGYGGHAGPRPSHQQLQPLVVPQWPSMLANQTSYTAYPQTTSGTMHHSPGSAQTPHPASAPPQMRPPVSKAHATNPRKTLTEADRRKMCLYHEKNPTAKQTEIGVLFGVERSTVSKVLRQKERYLETNDGSRSPMKKPRPKFPDIDRALMNWVKNQESKGHKLTDEKIREQAKFFSTATHGGAEAHANINSPKWLNDFKRRNNIGGARSRKSSFRALKSPCPTSSSPQHDARGSPGSDTSMATPSAAEMSAIEGSPRNTPPSVFSSGNTPVDSPFPQPSLIAEGHHGASLFSGMQIAPTAMQRSRSQTFSVLPGAGSGGYISPPTTSQTGTPKFASASIGMGSPQPSDMPPPSKMPPRSEPYQHQHQFHQVRLQHQQQQQHHGEQMNNSPTSHQQHYQQHHHSDSHPHQHQQQSQSDGHAMRATTNTPPSANFPSHSQTLSPSPSLSSSIPPPNRSPSHTVQHHPRQPSQDEARVALEVVMQYFQNQPTGTANAGGVAVEPQEFVMIGKLVEKLKVQTVLDRHEFA